MIKDNGVIDLEAISWAYIKLSAFGVGNSNMDSAMMMDRLNLMLQAEPAQECKCDLRTKLVGDGCAVCNPELAERYAEQQE